MQLKKNCHFKLQVINSVLNSLLCKINKKLYKHKSCKNNPKITKPVKLEYKPIYIIVILKFDCVKLGKLILASIRLLQRVGT